MRRSASVYVSSHQQILWILLLAFALRIAWGILVPVVPVSDSNAYDMFARNIAAGHGYGWKPGELTAYWAVGTPFVYALLYKVFGVSYLPIVILNIFIGGLSVLLVYCLAKRLHNEKTALTGALLLALWPSQIQFTTVLASELQFTFLVLLALCAWVSDALPRWPSILATGILLSAACYVRPTALLLPVLLAIMHFAKYRSLTRVLLHTVVLIIIMILPILPWSYRNYQIFGQFVLVSTNGGANMWMGNNPDTSGGYMSPPSPEGMNEAERDVYLKTLSREYILAHPLRFVARTMVKLVRLHERESIGISWNEEGMASRYPGSLVFALKLLSNVYWWAVLFGGLAGMLWFIIGSLRDTARPFLDRILTLAAHPGVLFWSYFAIIHTIIVIQDRYHFPSIPFIALFAALAVQCLSGRTWAACNPGLESVNTIDPHPAPRTEVIS
jgi:4-amino-4-deoxy-L-arabinose transferase-like glycosyltransferase